MHLSEATLLPPHKVSNSSIRSRKQGHPFPQDIGAHAATDCRYSRKVNYGNHYFFADVPDHLSLLASGMTPAGEADKAGGMTKVPQAQGLGGFFPVSLFLVYQFAPSTYLEDHSKAADALR